VLVVSDGALVDLANLVEGAVGELDAVVADRQPAALLSERLAPLKALSTILKCSIVKASLTFNFKETHYYLFVFWVYLAF
jgi:hypothetical protein